MKHNFIFKAAILIALLVFLAGTPYKVYADVQENIVTTEDGYADKQNDNVSGETDTNEIDNLETPEKIDSEENTVDEKKTEKEDKVTTENATENWRNLNWPIAVIAVLLTVLCVIGIMRAYKDKKNSQYFRELLENFDREYDKYKRNYAYCVEEILKKENGREVMDAEGILKDRTTKEVESESIAYIVCNHFIIIATRSETQR